MGNTDGFIRFCNDTRNTDIGYNFDTGHAWSCKECILSIPAKLAGRIRGTHLKDNFGTENNAWTLGEGSIPWRELLEALSATGYHDSLDLEIVCERPDDVLATYLSAKEFLETTAPYQQHRRQQ
jgi:sugar phosphate isomerase/epimerase